MRGGRRPGAGRKKKPANSKADPADTGVQFDCPLAYMRHVMNDSSADIGRRLEAARALATFTVAKPSATGKKAQLEKAAAAIAAGSRFASRPVPATVHKFPRSTPPDTEEPR